MFGIKGRIQPIDLKWGTLFRCLHSGAGAQNPSVAHRNVAPLKWLKMGILIHTEIPLWKWWPVDKIARSLLLCTTSLWLSNLQDKSVLGSSFIPQSLAALFLPRVQVLTNGSDPTYLFRIYIQISYHSTSAYTFWLHILVLRKHSLERKWIHQIGKKWENSKITEISENYRFQ